MTQEHEPRPAYIRITDVFGLTDKEQLYDFISDKRFQAIIQAEETKVQQVIIDTNNYGEFLFITVSREVSEKARFMTFWGLGFHEKKEQWLIQEWRFHESYIRNFPALISKDEALRQIQRRQNEIASEVTDTKPSERAILFSLLADLTDEDGATTELEDFSELGNLFDED